MKEPPAPISPTVNSLSPIWRSVDDHVVDSFGAIFHSQNGTNLKLGGDKGGEESISNSKMSWDKFLSKNEIRRPKNLSVVKLSLI